MTVVVGYVPNQYGEAAIDAGVQEARRRGARLVVVNTSRGDALVDPRFASRSALDALESRLAGVEHEVRQSVGPDVAEQVLDVVREVDAELLVIGLRHRTPVGKMLMGSVAQRLLMEAPCPVLAVKPARMAGTHPGRDLR
ncbi:MAG: universal stress protein [Actinomycetota bacterium]|nr:universal stress protein [Actinomycetota bacterium]